jgi:hypothetical protein
VSEALLSMRKQLSLALLILLPGLLCGCDQKVTPKSEALKGCNSYLSAGMGDTVTTTEQRKSALADAVASASQAAASDSRFTALHELLQSAARVAAQNNYAYDSLARRNDLAVGIASHCRDDAGQPP